MGIFSLPPELLRVIAGYLSVASATSLAQASPSRLEEAADSRIYRDIIITHAHQFAPTHNVVPVDSPPTSPTNRPITDPQQTTRTVLQSLGSKTVLQAHLAALRARPWRSGQVRKVDIQLGHTTPNELDDLLALVSGGLAELKVTRPSHVHLSTKEDRWQALDRPLELPDQQFHALRRVDIEVGPHWHRCLTNVFKRAPDVNALRVCGEVIQADPDPAAVGESADASIPAELNLEILDVGPISEAIVPLIADIIRNSPRLSHLRLNDPTGVWAAALGRTADDPLVMAISENSELRNLDVPSSCLSAIPDFEALDQLDHLTVVWTLADLNRRLPDPDSTTPAKELPLLPSLPGLKTCTFDLRSHDPGVPSYEVFRGSMFDLSVRAIRQHALLTSFASTPDLKSINLGSMYGLANVGPIGLDFDSPPNGRDDKWAGFDGALITHFTHDHDSDRLTVIRHRSAFSCGWELYGVFNGREVKTVCLAQLTDVEGRSLKKVEPGVGELSEDGWKILRHWTAHIP